MWPKGTYDQNEFLLKISQPEGVLEQEILKPIVHFYTLLGHIEGAGTSLFYRYVLYTVAHDSRLFMVIHEVK